jgi:hypothetical protein
MSGSDAPPAPNTYQFQNQAPADNQAFGGIQQMSGQQNYGQQAYDAFSPGLYGASGASGWDPAGTVQAGNNLSNNGQQLAGYGFQLLDKGMDPQNALYARTQQQLQDQVRAGQASRGISMTPYGAGLEGKAMSDFNIDWQNQAVNRGAQAAQGAAPLFQQGSQSTTAGQGLAMAAPALQQQLMQALQSGGLGTQAMPQQVLDNLFKYLSGGQGADQNAVNKYAQQVNAYKAESANQAAMLGGIGKMAGYALPMMMA